MSDGIDTIATIPTNTCTYMHIHAYTCTFLNHSFTYLYIRASTIHTQVCTGMCQYCRYWQFFWSLLEQLDVSRLHCSHPLFPLFPTEEVLDGLFWFALAALRPVWRQRIQECSLYTFIRNCWGRPSGFIFMPPVFISNFSRKKLRNLSRCGAAGEA